MKIFIIEANKEELAANKRVADVIVDTLTTFLDNFANIHNCNNDFANLNNFNDEDDDEYDDED